MLLIHRFYTVSHSLSTANAGNTGQTHFNTDAAYIIDFVQI